MTNCTKDNGFTFIELMITLGLVGVIVASGLNLYFFADRMFMSGSEVADVQADVQLAMGRITEEVRLAHSLEIISEFNLATDIPEDDPDDIHYLFAQDGSVFLRTKEFSRLILHGEPHVCYCVRFSPVEQGGNRLDNMLRVTLSSLGSEEDYALESELQILNLRLSGVQGEEPGAAIRFTKEFSKEVVDPAVGRRCPYSRYVYSGDAPRLVQLREFRDNYLSKSALGRCAIQVYYSVAPFVVSLLDFQPLARNVTTAFLRGIAEVALRFT